MRFKALRWSPGTLRAYWMTTWPCSIAWTVRPSGMGLGYTPVATVAAKCGPDVGGTELYRTDDALAGAMCGLSRMGTAVPGRQGEPRSVALDPVTAAEEKLYGPTARSAAIPPTASNSPDRQSQRRVCVIAALRCGAGVAPAGPTARDRRIGPGSRESVRRTPRKRSRSDQV